MTTRYSQTGQTTAILNYLLTAKNRWVAVYVLARLSGSCNVCNRVRDARKRGFKILNRVTQGPSGVKHSEYCLIQKKK